MCGCKQGGGIYIGASLNTAVTDGGLIPFADTTYAYGCGVKNKNTSILLCGRCKKFVIEGSLTLEAPSTGPLTVTVLQNGAPVDGGTFETTVAGTSANVIVPIFAVVSNDCAESSAITVQVSGQATTLSNESLSIKEWGV